MKNFFNYIRSVLSVFIMLLGVVFVSFFLNNEITFTSTIFGMIGMGILYPGVLKWEDIITKSND